MTCELYEKGQVELERDNQYASIVDGEVREMYKSFSIGFMSLQESYKLRDAILEDMQRRALNGIEVVPEEESNSGLSGTFRYPPKAIIPSPKDCKVIHVWTINAVCLTFGQ